MHAKVPADTADTGQMVAAREAFLNAGFYAAPAEALSEALGPPSETELIVDAGGGTGYYLAFVLQRRPDAYGLAIDVSVPALRKAAKAHPHITAVGWNLWQPWPIASGSANAILNVFAPRNAAEFHRVLRPDGRLVVVTPGTHHLVELSETLNLLSVDEDKHQRLDETLADHFALLERQRYDRIMSLSPANIRHVVLMGPNAHHLHHGDLDKRLDQRTEPIDTTASLLVSIYRRLP